MNRSKLLQSFKSLDVIFIICGLLKKIILKRPHLAVKHCFYCLNTCFSKIVVHIRHVFLRLTFFEKFKDIEIVWDEKNNIRAFEWWVLEHTLGALRLDKNLHTLRENVRVGRGSSESSLLCIHNKNMSKTFWWNSNLKFF